MARVTLSLETELHSDLLKIAEQRGISPQDLAVEALSSFVERDLSKPSHTLVVRHANGREFFRYRDYAPERQADRDAEQERALRAGASMVVTGRAV